MSRYAIGQWFVSTRVPWVTLGINLVGSFLLGFVVTISREHMAPEVRIPITVGFLGGFTTFSTFAWEGLTLGREDRIGEAVLYVAVSVLGGLVAAGTGLLLARTIR